MTYNQKMHEESINTGLSVSKDNPELSISYWNLKRFNFLHPDVEINDETGEP